MAKAGMLKSIFEKLMYDLRLRSQETTNYQVSMQIQASLEEIAAQERRSQDEVVVDLLQAGLTRRSELLELIQRWEKLSRREREVAALVCAGFNNAEIADRLHISINTVKTHVRHILFKFNVEKHEQLYHLIGDWDFSAFYPTFRKKR